MTKEEKMNKLVELNKAAEESATRYNEAIANGKYDEAHKEDTLMADAVGEYTSIAQEMCFEECKESGDPMLKAVTLRAFETITVKESMVGETVKVPVRSIVKKERVISLIKLEKYCGSIGQDKNWSHIAQKMNYLMTVRVCKKLKIDPTRINDSYSMSEIARQVKMFENNSTGKNYISNTSLLKNLQMVVTAMIGEQYIAKSEDLDYLKTVYAKKSRKALSVTCANHKYFVEYMMEICYHLVTGLPYNVEYKAKKDA